MGSDGTGGSYHSTIANIIIGVWQIDMMHLCCPTHVFLFETAMFETAHPLHCNCMWCVVSLNEHKVSITAREIAQCQISSVSLQELKSHPPNQKQQEPTLQVCYMHILAAPMLHALNLNGSCKARPSSSTSGSSRPRSAMASSSKKDKSFMPPIPQRSKRKDPLPAAAKVAGKNRNTTKRASSASKGRPASSTTRKPTVSQSRKTASSSTSSATDTVNEKARLQGLLNSLQQRATDELASSRQWDSCVEIVFTMRQSCFPVALLTQAYFDLRK